MTTPKGATGPVHQYAGYQLARQDATSFGIWQDGKYCNWRNTLTAAKQAVDQWNAADARRRSELDDFGNEDEEYYPETQDVSGVIGADGNVYSDADPGL